MVKFHTQEETDVDVLEEVMEEIGNQSQLVVYNDDHNTFDWVIDCFVDVLRHSPEQAEQCAMLIHFKGKAIVKTASFDELRPKKNALIEKGLSAVIEEIPA
ncbi:MAG: ATP-dependent Clp protease adaptor ClpS [Saprospiraceae bacterium]|jgi:ATP-dependent Clp protease adaptor protein ClpS|nr:ATP-dependent Clp protease adaptor ClpS [bacterium]MDB4414798.1 ATP-dependent Clp protease adaptor ClpS [bacterium]MDC3209884.1 ATP-dependent Clp protease adaptor ClpS [Saprospiraceae bacterium]MDG1434420.1 ATP-dependent Clp protease adaptor ClpS [Saprospiraceae bacterium]MDG2418518.1 ATP-dependent Clp protease adaptor ClpS [Saprospiraceae bacterium]